MIRTIYISLLLLVLTMTLAADDGYLVECEYDNPGSETIKVHTMQLVKKHLTTVYRHFSDMVVMQDNSENRKTQELAITRPVY